MDPKTGAFKIGISANKAVSPDITIGVHTRSKKICSPSERGLLTDVVNRYLLSNKYFNDKTIK
jgi:hypothetical protein